jgi:4-amino-4-deoxy-L-arabinose transferase-like glycosyltransferase
MGVTHSTVAAWVLLGAAALSTLYALLLNAIHDKYAPDRIWVTVVGGNALIGGLFALWLWLDPVLAGMTFAPFWRLLALNVAAGIPIIAWQIGQNNVRSLNRQRRNGNTHGPDNAGGPAAH